MDGVLIAIRTRIPAICRCIALVRIRVSVIRSVVDAIAWTTIPISMPGPSWTVVIPIIIIPTMVMVMIIIIVVMPVVMPMIVIMIC